MDKKALEGETEKDLKDLEMSQKENFIQDSHVNVDNNIGRRNEFVAKRTPTVINHINTNTSYSVVTV